MTDYSARSAAIRAARVSLGADKLVGVHFEIAEANGRFAWAAINLTTGEVEVPDPEDGMTPSERRAYEAHDAEQRAAAPASAFADTSRGPLPSDVPPFWPTSLKAVAEARAKKPRTPQVAPLAGMTPLGIAPSKANPSFPDPEALGAEIARQEGRQRPEEPAASRMSGKHKAALQAARKGHLPPEPDFTADTHKRWRPKLAEVVALAKAGDVAGLKAYEIKPVSTSPKAIDRYRSLALVALEARA